MVYGFFVFAVPSTNVCSNIIPSLLPDDPGQCSCRLSKTESLYYPYRLDALTGGRYGFSTAFNG